MTGSIMLNIIALVSQYELLELTSSNLSILDLLNLARTCSQLYALIRKPDTLFERLKRVSLCDGRGLIARQEYRGLHHIPQEELGSDNWGAMYDEELEIRVWNVKCDEKNALPCLKCGINICEECRCVPRVRDGYDCRSRRRPHLNDYGYANHLRCYCKSCDVEIEKSLPFRLSDFCDCDQYTRWICMKCKTEEDLEDSVYRRTRTKGEYVYPTIGDDGERDDGIWLPDHQNELAFWCPCGERSPSNGNIRCAWCLRKHQKHTQDTFIWNESRSTPFWDDDPCCTKDTWAYNRDDGMYPSLNYSGPIAP